MGPCAAPRPRGPSRRAALFAGLTLVGLAACDWPDPPDTDVPPPVTWMPSDAEADWSAPVEGRVIDPFRAPDHPYGPGNRGIEYRVSPGSPVRAAAGGGVVFAGPVAGRAVVVVEHGPGRRTTYTGLEHIDVLPGEEVVAGAELGTATSILHFGVKVDGRYVDPASLFGPPDVRLLPTE